MHAKTLSRPYLFHTLSSTVQALRECLRPEVTALAQALASRMELHGARIAAERLTNEFG